MTTPIKNIMSTGLIHVAKGSSSHEAFRLMKKNNIRHLPVQDENGHVTGVISQRDLNSLPAADDPPVEFIMNCSVEYADQNLSLKEAIHTMLKHKASCLLITNENKHPVGIVTTDDLLAYLAHLLTADEKEQNHPVFSAMDLQTIGKVADSLSIIGI